MRLKDESSSAARLMAVHDSYEAEMSCPQCATLLQSHSAGPDVTGRGNGEQLSRVRSIMLPVAVLTVITASALKLIH
jgi:hypothetical protein